VATQREEDSWENSGGVKEEPVGSEGPVREMVSSNESKRGRGTHLFPVWKVSQGPEVTFLFIIPGRDPSGSYLRELHATHTNQTFESLRASKTKISNHTTITVTSGDSIPNHVPTPIHHGFQVVISTTAGSRGRLLSGGKLCKQPVTRTFHVPSNAHGLRIPFKRVSAPSL